MTRPGNRPMPHVEVPDAAAAFHKAEEFTRRLLAVPKKKVDAMLARNKAKKNAKNRN